MKTTPISFRVSEVVNAELVAEISEKGYKNMNAYMVDIVERRNIKPGETVYSKDPQQEIIIDELLERERQLIHQTDELNQTIADLKAELQNKKAPGLDKILAHYEKRAWEIARITKEQLQKGFGV